MIPGYIIAGLWGAIGSFAIIIGAFFGCRYNISKRMIAIITAFSSGILISAVCFELLFEANSYGGIYPTALGFIAGVILFTLMDAIIHKYSVERYKTDYDPNFNIKREHNEYSDASISYNNITNINNSSNSTNEINNLNNNTNEISNLNNSINYINDHDNGTGGINNYNIIKHRYTRYFNKYQVKGLTTIVGAILDGIPEAVAIGLTFFIGGPISISLLIAVFIANSFEGATASLYMRLGGWSKKEILETWILLIILTTFSAISSYIIFSNTDQHILAGALAVAAGAILAMIADTMLPEAYNEMHEWTGFIMCMGFLVSFVLSYILI